MPRLLRAGCCWHWLLRHGVTPDVITLTGTAGSTVAALVLVPTGHLFAATMIVWGFVMFDMLDGAVARVFDGVGVVADSDPSAELAETRAKLQALLTAIVRP